MPPHTMMDHNTNLVRPEGEPMVVNANGSSSVGGTSDPEGATPARVKCVLVGDGAVGKTSLVVSYTTNGYPTEYMPTAFDNYSVRVTVDSKPVQLQLCDTAGQDDFDTLRPLCYPDSHVFLLCFSVVSPTSFHNVLEKWVPELRRHCPGAPLVLVGTQSDLRNDVKVLIELSKYGGQRPVPEEDAMRLAEQLGAQYVECSALTQKNLKEVFDTGILASLNWPVNSREDEAAGGLLGRSKSLLLRKSKRSKSGKDNGGVGGPATAVLVPSNSTSSASSSAAAGAGKGSSPTKKAAWKKLCCFM